MPEFHGLIKRRRGACCALTATQRTPFIWYIGCCRANRYCTHCPEGTTSLVGRHSPACPTSTGHTRDALLGTRVVLHSQEPS